MATSFFYPSSQQPKINNMNITRTSWVSGEVNTLDLPITQEQLDLYAAGALLQDAFKNLNADEREFIKSGITAEEWEELFGSKEGWI